MSTGTPRVSRAGDWPFLATPVTVGVGLWMWYNVARFGHPFDMGLLRDPNVAFDTPLVTGLAGLLASSRPFTVSVRAADDRWGGRPAGTRSS